MCINETEQTVQYLLHIIVPEGEGSLVWNEVGGERGGGGTLPSNRLEK